jgi:hypothetical protein
MSDYNLKPKKDRFSGLAETMESVGIFISIVR